MAGAEVYCTIGRSVYKVEYKLCEVESDGAVPQGIVSTRDCWNMLGLWVDVTRSVPYQNTGLKNTQTLQLILLIHTQLASRKVTFLRMLTGTFVGA